jgi:hypothetical protein
LDLLNTLLKLPILNSFYLVGGTALALKFGHRISIDLDLFSIEDFNKEKVIQELANSFPNFVYKADNSTIGVFCTINGIKVDLIKNHWFKLIDEIDEIEGVRMFGNKDLIAMKISAILKRGQKKDFYDLCQLLKIFSIQDGIDFYHEKFPNQQVLISIPNAITYFADAEESPEPISLNGQSWEEVKRSIQKAVRDFL